jgi:hypothetical protein
LYISESRPVLCTAFIFLFKWRGVGMDPGVHAIQSIPQRVWYCYHYPRTGDYNGVFLPKTYVRIEDCLFW